MLPLNDDTPTDSTPVVTISFIVACSLIFLYQSALPPTPGEILVYQYGAIPAVLFGHAALPPEAMAIPAFSTVLTSMLKPVASPVCECGTQSMIRFGADA